jgi:hypothetical protein
MPFIPVDVQSAKEDELVPEGEYELEVTSAKEQDSKAGRPMIAIVHAILDPPDDVVLAAPVFFYMTLPVTAEVATEKGIEADDSETIQRKLRDIRRYLVMMNVPFSSEGFDADSLVGARGSARVTQEEMTDRATGKGTGNHSHRLNLRRVTDEEASRSASPARGGAKRRARA